MPDESVRAQAPYAELAVLATRALAGDNLDIIEKRAHAIRAAAGDNTALTAAAASVVDAARRNRDSEALLRASEERLAEAQRIGRMGSYDWDISTNTNVWSDELYRIYGTEPQSLNASYERFIEFIHPDDREHVMAVHQRAYETCEPYETEERIVCLDGEVRVLQSWGEVVTDENGTPMRMRGICRDVTEARQAEEAILRLHNAEERRRHALEINDNVVQGLTAAIYSFESGFEDVALTVLRHTLKSARLMMDNLLGGSADELDPAALTRSHAAPQMAAPVAPLPPPGLTPRSDATRVVIVDDADDVRLLLRHALESLPSFTVVGEAANGEDGIEQIAALLPDVAVVDLAMPTMSGLNTMRIVRQRHPGIKLVALSGFDRQRMEDAAFDAGADAYLEKGTALRDIAAVLESVVAGTSPRLTNLVT